MTISTQPDRKPLGEIIATSYGSFTVESYELNSTPPLGALVTAQNVLGVVSSARTEGLGPISARGSLEDEDGSVYATYPDLQRTLRSQFTALVVGCYEVRNESDQSKIQNPKSKIIYSYPQCPPTIHYKCYQATGAELAVFTERPDYIRLLLTSVDAASTNIDQVLIHLILHAYHAHDQDRAWLATTAEYLGRQLKGQYDRLLAILKTLDALTTPIPTEQPSTLSDAVGKVKL